MCKNVELRKNWQLLKGDNFRHAMHLSIWRHHDKMLTHFRCGERRINLTKVRPLFTLSHRGSDNSPLLIVFSANYIDQSNRNVMCLKVFRKLWPFDLFNLSIYLMSEVTRKRNFHHLQKYCAVFKLRFLIGRDHDAICKLQSSLDYNQ